MKPYSVVTSMAILLLLVVGNGCRREPGVAGTLLRDASMSTDAASVTTVMVAGTGEGVYTVYDASGKIELGSRNTNVPLEVFPGDYVVEMNGARQPLKVREKQRASVTAGAVMVAGTGQGVYTVYDASGKIELGSRNTNVPLEVFPGNFLIEVDGVKKPVTVRQGQQAVLRQSR